MKPFIAVRNSIVLVPLLLSVTFTGSHKRSSFQDYIINYSHKKLPDTGPGTVRADVLTYLGYLGQGTLTEGEG
jgi:hypothetical protein